MDFHRIVIGPLWPMSKQSVLCGWAIDRCCREVNNCVLRFEKFMLLHSLCNFAQNIIVLFVSHLSSKVLYGARKFAQSAININTG